MSGTNTLGDFGTGLQKLIDETVKTKMNEIDEREKALIEREKKMQQFFESNHTKGQIRIRVGDRLFYTTSDVLLSQKDSYFSGLLNPQFAKPEDGIFFIAREAAVFEFVLEYLLYGQLVSNL